MRVAIESFRGEAPRVAPRALPANASQLAINARLQSGDLETWRGLLETATLRNDAQTIYLLDDAWLSWEADVDVARGIIPGDTTFRVYLTGPDVYDRPQFTNYAMATTGSAPYPVATRPVGVPGPDSVPSLVIGLDSTPTTFSIDVLDEGDALETSWVTSSPRGGSTLSQVVQSESLGNPAPSYELRYDEIHNNGEQPFAYRNFGIADATVVHVSCDIMFHADTSQKTAWLGVASSQTGSGIMVGVEQGNFWIRNAVEWSPYSASGVDNALTGSLSAGVWYTIDVTVVTNADNTQTVTARLFQGSGLVIEVIATSVFTNGDYCGITAAWPDDASPYYATNFDNIHVQASGSNGFTPVDIATSYVFTFVNDLGEESVPSLPSGTIQRPDGVAVTVTTPTDVPSGVDAVYGITTKRIYRAATGNTGTVFRFVAEIDLATADYVDVLADSELGEVLESEEYDLPPDDLRGVLALPNGIMVGFSKNQLCLSERNRPHAWPVSVRLTTDTDIVAIENVDNTVVIGTESYPYMATGTDPETFSMTKLEVQQACVAKRSIGTITGIGVVLASPDGVMAVQGPGQVRNLTDGIFTRRQWQDLNPSTLRSVVHDDVYFFWVGDGSSGADTGYALDMKPNGFGLIRLGFYAKAMYADPLTDKLYLSQTGGPVATTVFALFHFLDSGATDEGLQEFGVVEGEAFDQTDASWGTDDDRYEIRTSSPAPKFGGGYLGPFVNPEFDIIVGASLGRSSDQSSIDRLNNEPFALDMWVYPVSQVETDGSPNSAVLYISGGAAGAYIEVVGKQSAGPGSINAVFSNGEGGSAMLTVETTTYDAWVHVRANYDGTTAKLAVDGTVEDSAAIDMSPMSIVSQCNVSLQINNEDHDYHYVDEVYVICGTALSSGNFTPPTTPWPNPEIGDEPEQGDGSTIFEFDGDAGEPLSYTWRGKFNLLPRPAAFTFCQVQAQDYVDLALRIYGDGALLFQVPVTSKEPFTLPIGNEYETFEAEFVGTSRVRTAQFVEDVLELQ